MRAHCIRANAQESAKSSRERESVGCKASARHVKIIWPLFKCALTLSFHSHALRAAHEGLAQSLHDGAQLRKQQRVRAQESVSERARPKNDTGDCAAASRRCRYFHSGAHNFDLAKSDDGSVVAVAAGVAVDVDSAVCRLS